MAEGRSSCFARTVTRRAVTSTDGNGTGFRDGRTESGASVGDVAHAPGCATLVKAAICVPPMDGLGSLASCFARPGETCHAQCPGSLMCSPRLKSRQKAGSVSCHPCLGTGSGRVSVLGLIPISPRNNIFGSYGRFQMPYSSGCGCVRKRNNAMRGARRRSTFLAALASGKGHAVGLNLRFEDVDGPIIVNQNVSTKTTMIFRRTSFCIS
jgi:hypothetical protein